MAKISDWLDAGARWLITAMMMVETVVVFGGVVSRYVFNSSWTWSDEVARALLTWMVFMGASAACKRLELVGLSAFPDSLKPRVRRVFDLIGGAIICAFLLIVTVYSIQLMQRTAAQVTPVLRVKLSWVYLSMPLAFGLMFLHTLRNLFERPTAKAEGADQAQPSHSGGGN